MTVFYNAVVETKNILNSSKSVRVVVKVFLISLMASFAAGRNL